MAGMGSPALDTRARFGTKELVTDYIGEVCAALDQLQDVNESEISFKDKLRLYRRARLCFGRPALMLSGAGSLGPFHMGVVKALAEQDLLPRIISGASGGAVVGAIAGTRTPDQLPELFASEGPMTALNMLADAQATPSNRPRIQLQDVNDLLDTAIPDMTFAEAFEETGRSINVSVAPAQVHQRSRLLNSITSPNVIIRDAVRASCAIPGVFPAVTLMAKDASGNKRPYVPSRKWVDGSMTGDLPARRLSRLYGVNFFISSQTNPFVLWALQDPHGASDPLSRFLAIYQSAGRDWLRAVYPISMDMVRDIYPLNMLTRMWFDLVTQEYTADVNIIPRRRIYDPSMLLARLPVEEVSKLMQEGQRSAWPKIEMIRNCTMISRRIEDILRELEDRMEPIGQTGTGAAEAAVA